MNRVADEMQRMIAVASGSSPAWLAEKKDLNWLEAIYELVKAGIVLVKNDGPKLVEGVPVDLLLRCNAQLYIVFKV